MLWHFKVLFVKLLNLQKLDNFKSKFFRGMYWHKTSWLWGTFWQKMQIQPTFCPKCYHKGHRQWVIIVLVTNSSTNEPFNIRYYNLYQFRSTALCSYPLVKMEIQDSIQILTTAPIFLQSNYFRQNIWRSPAAQIHFWFMFGYELTTVYCSSKNCKRISCNLSILQVGCEKNCGHKLNTSPR